MTEKKKKEIKVQDLDTPAVIIREAILARNIMDMARFSQEAGIKLRPHAKSHKLSRLARIQINQGAVGITVAKLDEAEAMLNDGVEDILIAYPLVGEKKIRRLLKLNARGKLAVVADSPEGIENLASTAREDGQTLKVLLKIDTGLKRCGVKPGKRAVELAKKIDGSENLDFGGILTHAGHAYASSGPEEVQKIACQEGEIMASLAEDIKKSGIDCPEVSVGATPTVKISGMVEGVTEIRPGNYVFNDRMQLNLGVAMEEDCSLTVLSQVVSRPVPERCVIDAGSKTLGLDQGAHGNPAISGYGLIKGHTDAVITRLSEEHGVVEIPADSDLKIGDKIEIIPNHACPVTNLASSVNIIRNEELWEEWEVSARGSK